MYLCFLFTCTGQTPPSDRTPHLLVAGSAPGHLQVPGPPTWEAGSVSAQVWIFLPAEKFYSKNLKIDILLVKVFLPFQVQPFWLHQKFSLLLSIHYLITHWMFGFIPLKPFAALKNYQSSHLRLQKIICCKYFCVNVDLTKRCLNKICMNVLRLHYFTVLKYLPKQWLLLQIISLTCCLNSGLTLVWRRSAQLRCRAANVLF